MTEFDSVLEELATSIRPLSERAVVGLFWSCSSALVPAFEVWASHRGATTGETLNSALLAGFSFASRGEAPADIASLLEALEESAPEGESPDEVSSTSAQDCWICADVAIRVLVDPAYDPGPGIEFALEPTITRASEELLGNSQIGSGDEEEAETRELLGHPAVASGIAFCRWALDYLSHRPSPAEQDLHLLRSRAAAALAP